MRATTTLSATAMANAPTACVDGGASNASPSSAAPLLNRLPSELLPVILLTSLARRPETPVLRRPATVSTSVMTETGETVWSDCWLTPGLPASSM